MSVELQIRSRGIVEAATLLAERQARAECAPPVLNTYLDHVAVDAHAATVVVQAGTVVVQVPLDVFVVEKSAVLAAPNGTPAGATTPVARVMLEQEVAARVVNGRPEIVWTPRPIAGLPPGISVPAPAVPQGADLSAMFEQLALRMPFAADTALVEGIVAFRFDPVGAPGAHLPPDNEWGLFLSGSEWEDMIFPQLVRAAGNTVPMRIENPVWRPAGELPRVEFAGSVEASLSIAGELVDLGFDAAIHATVDVACEFRLLPQVNVVRVTARWSNLRIAGAPDWLSGLIEPAVEDHIKPEAFGAVPAGPRAFSIDVPLALPPMLGGALTVDALRAAPDGATLSGETVLIRPARDAFGIDVSPLGPPTRLQLCSQIAKTGGDRPDRTPLTVENTASYGSVTFTGAGAFCGYEQVTPAFVKSYVRAVPGADAETFDIRVRIPYVVALEMRRPLRFVVRTTRGVRLIDLGMAPPVERDGDGTIAGNDWWIPNCLHVDAALTGWATSSGGGQLRIDRLKPPPLEHPDWTRFVAAGHGVSVQLVTLTGLDPGEIVRFRSATHDVEAAASADGGLALPVLVPFGDAVSTGLIERINRQSLERRVEMAVIDFEHRLTLPSERGEAVPIGDGHRAAVVEVQPDTTIVDVLDGNGGRSRVVARHDGTIDALNPQPLPPSPDVVRERLGVRDVVNVIAVPGFEQSAASIAVLADGSQLLLEAHEDGRMRIAGTFRGPIGQVARGGAWAVAADAERAVVLSVA